MNENGTGNIRDGKYIKEGYSAELDEVRSLLKTAGNGLPIWKNEKKKNRD